MKIWPGKGENRASGGRETPGGGPPRAPLGDVWKVSWRSESEQQEGRPILAWAHGADEKKPPGQGGLGQAGGSQPGRLASMTVSAAMLTMRRTVALEVRMFTGALAPSRKGPTATLPPAAVLSRL